MYGLQRMLWSQASNRLSFCMRNLKIRVITNLLSGAAASCHVEVGYGVLLHAMGYAMHPVWDDSGILTAVRSALQKRRKRQAQDGAQACVVGVCSASRATRIKGSKFDVAAVASGVSTRYG